ncbi:ATP synthase subunit I [Pontibacillus yanchengensis]|uniref:ATP synthase I n=3 Tax=Pontibacillus yanchengensis TaxID=462910 RepID=A0A0A2TD09_9BACI|nr:ATP synthase subunit I [Pontibacillus yanchengensis]KGP71971.1 ATP synthase I [Pontibacillus yanchengensis Y32]MYL36163.1 ATP synthase subunit I [Pontibacillus yanchengensis]MYL54622.1 ATP synthase subunit I [Pontibacillus yanchengensis]
MPEQFQTMMTRQRKWMLYLLALLVLGWGFLPYQHIFLGLILGALFSFFNLWLMHRKVNHIGQAASENRTGRALGSFSRFAAGGLAILIALRFNQHFHLIAVVIGLMTTYVVIMIEFLFSKLRD